MATIRLAEHSHTACADKMIGEVEAHCIANKLRFTPTRRRVLEFLHEEHRALGAYDILQRLTKERPGAQPTVVYRALDFLLTHGFAHRVERLNAYVACAHPLEAHAPAFLVCRMCDAVAEASWSPSEGEFGKAARAAGFRIERTAVEAEGLCPDCVAAGAGA